MVARMVALVAVLIATTGSASDGVTLLEFASKECAPCRQMQPVIDQLISEGWIVRQVDVDREADFARRWRIAHLPTVIVVREGREVDRIVGAIPLETLRHRLGESSRDPNRARAAVAQRADAGEESSIAAGPIVRGQSPMMVDAAREMRELAQLASRSLQGSMRVDPASATVRICVDDGHSEAFGTGTIIDTQGHDALVITCGHIFREGQGQSPMTVDVYLQGGKRTYPAKAVYYRADETDIGLLAFRADQPLPKVAVLPYGERLNEKQRVFSFGCDGGADPSRRDTLISKLNRYLGPSNVEIAGAPVQGRSGGGLFDELGRLIGVCYAADKQLDEGLYSGPEVIYEALAAIGMQKLCLPPTIAPRAQATEPASANAPVQITATIQRPGQPDQVLRISNATPELLQLLDRNQVR